MKSGLSYSRKSKNAASDAAFWAPASDLLAREAAGAMHSVNGPSSPVKAASYCRVSTRQQAEDGALLITPEELSCHLAFERGYIPDALP